MTDALVADDQERVAGLQLRRRPVRGRRWCRRAAAPTDCPSGRQRVPVGFGEDVGRGLERSAGFALAPGTLCTVVPAGMVMASVVGSLGSRARR